MLGIRPAITFLEGQRKDASLRRLELRPVISLLRGELYARQAIARGDDMCYMVVIPSIKLYRFEV